MWISIIFINLFIAFPVPLPPHPIHVALTTVEYQPEKEQFAVTFKIFYDDLESIIAEDYGVALNLGKPDENPETAVWFQRYLDEHFSLLVNDSKKLPLKYSSKEINEKAIWLYCRIPYTGKINRITLTNTVMMDMYFDQTDLVIFKFDNIEKGLRFHRKYYSESFTVGKKL
ncbi:MAG: hypothetical protein GXO83_09130 [Chlorobi bacterium]|nr:hypothetical protein [Chlorobiota bacterium]